MSLGIILFLMLKIDGTGDSTLMPVMFWIHGGGFVDGSGSANLYGPEFLVARNVVLVTVNYRLGMLGNKIIRNPLTAH